MSVIGDLPLLSLQRRAGLGIIANRFAGHYRGLIPPAAISTTFVGDSSIVACHYRRLATYAVASMTFAEEVNPVATSMAVTRGCSYPKSPKQLEIQSLLPESDYLPQSLFKD
ncbi:Hypothetical predicted protein [Olea europaea subsp. europaea]|uniref:Uncharacterized protein n=1 Tax=Olea europaea subsp. europaea TaxID=158383 RepID=A0A8S0RUH4_OLEEU|nr:Hypothetical predicted protein [Olea europaea subsp. europaea]